MSRPVATSATAVSPHTPGGPATGLIQPFRQVHLDFHTSEHIADLLADWDADRFGDTLAAAHVASIQVFARCWHGWMYYPSARFPEAVHPALRGRDLLGEQLAACHRRGIRAPIYVAMEVDRRMADLHPEWTRRLPDGSPVGGRGVFEPGFSAPLCLHSPFLDFLEAQLDELLERYGDAVDGFWFDGATPQNCCCRHCLPAMIAEGLDPTDDTARRGFGLGVVERAQRRLAARVRARRPRATLFFNSGHIGPRHRRESPDFSHFEIESLPGGGWGYLHFPIAARLARTFGLPVVGMTGKFHTSWGDFHSFKNPAALEFECFQMLALGAACSVGDQLHPRGALCPHTYALIGRVFAAVEAVEPWCRDARPLAEVALLTPEIIGQEPWDRLLPEPIIGAVRLLQECAVQFDLLPAVYGAELDLAPYRVVILPDTLALPPALAAVLEKHLAGGGAVLSTGTAGRDPATGDFALPASWALRAAGPRTGPNFVRAAGPLARGLPATEHVLYIGGDPVELVSGGGAEVLLEGSAPYFERTWRHFCSHKHAPSSGAPAGPFAARRERVIHFTHPLFTIYREHTPRWCRELVHNALDLLLGGRPLLRHDGPSALSANLHAQPAHRRWVLHLLHAVPERRGRELDVIEELGRWNDLRLEIAAPARVASVRLVPGGDALAFEQDADDGVLRFTLPRLDGRQLVSIKFADPIA